jgi:hypothetical protein
MSSQREQIGSSHGEQIGARGAVSEVTVKVKVRTFLKEMGYGVELIEDALKRHGPDQDLCVQYCAARSPKQTQTVAQPSSLTPMVQQKRDALRQQLQRMGYREPHIDAAMERCNIDAQSVSLVTAFTWCCEFIQRELDPPGKPHQPLSQAPLTTSWKATVAAPALDIRAELKRMGYTDQQVDSAVTRGCSDLNACVQYLLSAESSSKASSHAPVPASAPSPGNGGAGATTSSKMVISANQRQLVNMDCALFNPFLPSIVTLTRVLLGIQGLDLQNCSRAQGGPKKYIRARWPNSS